MEKINVLPVNDLREHIENETCWCEPKIEEEDNGILIIHNSLDERELYEEGIKKPH